MKDGSLVVSLFLSGGIVFASLGLPEKGRAVVEHPEGVRFLLSAFVFIYAHLATGKLSFTHRGSCA